MARKMVCYCRACGTQMEIDITTAPYGGEFCGKECCGDFQNRIADAICHRAVHFWPCTSRGPICGADPSKESWSCEPSKVTCRKCKMFGLEE